MNCNVKPHLMGINNMVAVMDCIFQTHNALVVQKAITLNKWVSFIALFVPQRTLIQDSMQLYVNKNMPDINQYMMKYIKFVW